MPAPSPRPSRTIELLIATTATIYAERRRENYDLSSAQEVLEDAMRDAAILIAVAIERGDQLIDDARATLRTHTPAAGA